MTIFQYLIDRFYSKQIGNKQYIDVTPVLATYKAQRGKSRTTISNFFQATNIKYTMIKLKDDKIASNIDISQYHPKTYKILLEVDSIIKCETLAPLIENTYREAYAKALSELETTIVEESSSDNSITTETLIPVAAPTVAPVVATTIVTSSQYEIIELDESEMFKNINDEPVDIEVRGARTPDGILFSAVDIGKYLGMKKLLDVLQDTRGVYEKNTHWVKLFQYSDRICTSSISRKLRLMRDNNHDENDSHSDQDDTKNNEDIHTSRMAGNLRLMRDNKPVENDSHSDQDDTKNNEDIHTSRMTDPKSAMRDNNHDENDSHSDQDDTKNNGDHSKFIWKRIYLTMNGLLKVMFSSTSANENVTQLRNWVINLVFVHQFGSPTERMDLVESLTPYKKCLNKLPGIYAICIGKVKDLRKSMNISNDLYPDNKFDNACIFKFGRSDDIMTRYKQHCERTGYGKYSDSISLEWFVVIPPKLCSNAESDLSKYLDLHQFKFAFNDGSKDHTELIIVKPGTEKKHIKDKYFELVKSFPGEANAIIEQMTQIKLDRDQLIDRMNLQHENELLKIGHQLDLLKVTSESDKKDLAHQVEILQLKLELASRK